MASLKQIAQELGVSHVLVSRVLSNRMGTTRVSAKTREAILKRAKELDFQPNPLAVALKRGRKGVVGLFIHTVGVEGSELGLAFIRSAAQTLSERGTNLWLQFFGLDVEFLAACNETLMRKVDGLIVAGLPHEGLISNLAKIEKMGLNVAVACTGLKPSSELVNFQVDAEMQGYLPTRHMLDLGCKRVGFFWQNPDDRFQGYLRAHKESRVTPAVPEKDKFEYIAKNFSSASGYELMKKIVESGVKFDGITTPSDASAAGAIRYLMDAGVARKDFPKITGMDNSPIARCYSNIPLTSVTSEMERCAELVVGAIMDKLEGIPVRSQMIEPRLVIRESTVPGLESVG